MRYSLPSASGRAVIGIAAEMMEHDLEAVTSLRPERTGYKDADVRVSNLATADATELGEIEGAGIDTAMIKGKPDSFILTTRNGKLYIIGADDRGTAYGILELSRLAGVSPWVWWNDVTPHGKEHISISDDTNIISVPSVQYRGIFINDEDWSLHPWSNLTHDPTAPKGSIGAGTYRRIFELLLRLRANTMWPAMHECTLPFFFTPGARETADSFAIAIGTSHCEPLLRNNVGEWDKAVRGPYNFITNRDNVTAYWTERLIEAGRNENLYTIGMRGIHDGNMEGVKTMDEKVKGLQEVIDAQRNLLATHVNADLTSVPQIFVPYKEVLDIMDNGLTIPEDVTLMWCDDNYGHLTRLSDRDQQQRPGGAGIYYHLSYWGRPHDYLWLGTTQPGLIYHEMRNAYDHNARKVWIANIHDPKTSSYGLELFLDMAWDINSVTASSVETHLKGWLAREFGAENAESLLHIMKEYYRLCAIRRPEHMGWSQVELSDRKVYPRGRSQVTDTEFSFTEMGNEADRYLESFKKIA
ncbi:MAG: glycosyl hydrolase 115 family protein, partial [Duncaniella sp.]|nr:glycosyl hydrolase 115 family protein [Duncaniella sp.]